MTHFLTIASLYTTARAPREAMASDIRSAFRPDRHTRGVTPIKVVTDLPDDEQAGEGKQRQTEDVHLVIDRAGGQDQSDNAEHQHHQPDDQVAWLYVHLMLRTLMFNTGMLHAGSRARARPTDGPRRPCPAAWDATLIQIKTTAGGVGHGMRHGRSAGDAGGVVRPPGHGLASGPSCRRAVRRAAARRGRGQRGALRADVRAVRAGPGVGPAGPPAGRAPVRAPAGRQRAVAAVPRRAIVHVWRAGGAGGRRRRGAGAAGLVRLAVGHPAGAGGAAVPGARAPAAGPSPRLGGAGRGPGAGWVDPADPASVRAGRPAAADGRTAAGTDAGVPALRVPVCRAGRRRG